MLKHEWPLSRQEITELYDSNLVTFDLFETIVYRPISKRDSFEVYKGFSKAIRRQSEFTWRCFQKLHILGDFRLEVLRKILGGRIDLEFEYDLQILQARPAVLDLIKELQARQIRIIIVTNSYYSPEQIQTICEKCEIPQPIEIVVSSSFGLVKNQGLLQAAVDELPENHWHFGDDLKQDGSVSLDHFVLMTSPWELASEFGTHFPERTARDREMIMVLRAFLKIIMGREFSSTETWFYFGVFFSGPMSVYIAEYLQKFKAENDELLVFLARDGYLPYKYLEGEKSYNTTYIPYSRAISKEPSNIERIQTHLNEFDQVTNYIFFDLGWRGISSSKISKPFGNYGKLVLAGRWPWHEKIEDSTIFFPRGIRGLSIALKFRACPELIELALTAPDKSLTKLPASISEWPLDKKKNKIHPNSSIVSGALEFQREWRAQGARQQSPHSSFSSLLQVMRNPTNSQLSILSQIGHVYKGVEVPLVSLGNDPVTFWIKGSWRWQRYNNISLRKRFLFAGKELIRRVSLK